MPVKCKLAESKTKTIEGQNLFQHAQIVFSIEIVDLEASCDATYAKWIEMQPSTIPSIYLEKRHHASRQAKKGSA